MTELLDKWQRLCNDMDERHTDDEYQEIADAMTDIEETLFVEFGLVWGVHYGL